MDLIVHHMAKLEDVARAHRDGVLKRLAGAAVIEDGLALVELRDKLLSHVLAKVTPRPIHHVDVSAAQRLSHLFVGGAVKEWCGDKHVPLDDPIGVVVLGIPAMSCSPAEVALHELPHVHAGGDAEGIE